MERFRKSKVARVLRREQGQMLALFAASLVAICGFVGMSVDVGQLVVAATEAQKIADASALAASQDLPNTTTATSTANTYGTKNGSATLATTFEQSNTVVRVEATKHVNYTFLRVLGMTGHDVSRSAKAMGRPVTVTGYTWANTAPFIIWGGTRQSEVHTGDQSCALHSCVGRSYTFMDTGWMTASGTPKAPDWTSADSNNFKGDVDHGNGAPVNQVGETFSVGGLGSVFVPIVGTIIVIPIVDRAAGNSSLRSFRVAAWAIVRVDPGCNKNHCSGTILNPAATAPPSGWVGGGSTSPPASLTYSGRQAGLIQ